MVSTFLDKTSISSVDFNPLSISVSTLHRANDLSFATNDTVNEAQEPITHRPMIFSFFAGAGFLDLGFEMAGYRIAYVNEIHKPFLEAYQYSRKKMGMLEPLYGYFGGDIGQCLYGTEAERLTHLIKKNRHDKQLIGFIGGPPCPDFSVAGKNRGQYGENGQLSQVFINLIIKQLPDFFIFENVKGLYRTTRHREFFNSLKKQLADSGYVCTERLINALDYGVPQYRERIILVGIRSDRLKSDLKKFNWNAHVLYPDQQALKYPWPCAQPVSLNRTQPEDIPIELTVQYWFNKNGIATHPNAKHQFKPRAGLEKFQTIDEGDDSKKSYKRLHRWRYSPTAAYGNNEVHIHPYLPRRISVAEALAMQSLPAVFELPDNMTLSNMFKTVGNGVPFLAAQGLALTLLDFLRDSDVCN